MHVTLLVPDLFWPRDDGGGAYRGLELPAAQLLLTRATCRHFSPVSTEAWLCQAFEVERQHDWPVAPLTLDIDGGDAGKDYWLRADPVHFAARRDRVTLLDKDLLHLNAEEAAELVALLNRHFASDNLVFQAPQPSRWYLKTPGTPRLTTHELSLSAGRDVATLMPSGEDSPRWRRVLTEIQMLLHDHPVNQRREARGELPANSLWLWGGGRQTAVSGRHFTHVVADEALALALAVKSGAETIVPPGLKDGNLSAASRDSRLLVVADAHAAVYGDDQSWQGRLVEIERDWFAPVLTALNRRVIESVAVVALHPRACLRFEANRTGMLKFWKRPRPLSSHAPGAT